MGAVALAMRKGLLAVALDSPNVSATWLDAKLGPWGCQYLHVSVAAVCAEVNVRSRAHVRRDSMTREHVMFEVLY